MPVAFEQIETEALQLDRNERIILGQELLQSAITMQETPQEKAWYDEAERRIAAIEAGEMKTYPGPETIDKLIAEIRAK